MDELLERKRRARLERAKVIVTAARVLAAETTQRSATEPSLPRYEAHRRRLARILSVQSRPAPT
jgi:hypothetical protein